MVVVYFIRCSCASELVAHIKQWIRETPRETTALTRRTTNTNEDCHTDAGMHPPVTRSTSNPHTCGLLVWGRFSWVDLFPNGADIALHPACTFVFRSVHQHGWRLVTKSCLVFTGDTANLHSCWLHCWNRFASTSIHTIAQRLLGCFGSCTPAQSGQSLVSMSTAAE